MIKSILLFVVVWFSAHAIMAQNDCSTIPNWATGDIYFKNDAVQFNGNKYVANWWTQGDNPEQNSGQWEVWTLSGACTGSNILPEVTITQPTNGSSYTQGDNISLSANATDADGSVVNVAFFYNSISIGVSNSAPFQISWNSIPAGNHVLTAKATDNAGGTSISTPVNISVSGGSNQLPSIVLTAPSNGSQFSEGETILLSATASDPDGSITKVAFYQGTSLLSEDNIAPFSYNWSNVSAGEYAISAVATDNEGATTASSIVSIQVNGVSNGDYALNNLPLQINQNNGASVTYTFDGVIENVLSRNRGVANFTIAGNAITVQGLKPGRTGLKITSGGQHYYMGLRVNKADGSRPGLPKYLSIGSVSEDKAADIGFWEDIDTDFTNKEMDIRYIYINGGAIGGWRTWGPDRPRKFAENSIRLGLIPFFVYYNIPDNGESYEGDLAHVRDVNYMTEYFIDLNTFMEEVQSVADGELYGIVLEPDFLGYMQQQSGTEDPTEIATAVTLSTISPNAGNIRTLVERINKTIEDKRNAGHSIFFGWQLNLWAYPNAGTGQGVLRITDTKGFDAGREEIKEAATQTTLFAIASGTLTHGANFLSIDKYGLDAMGHINDPDPSKSRWFFNNDHWNNYLYFVKNMHTVSGFPIILWQLPVGHINGTTQQSAYTGSSFPDLTNTDTRYEDSSSDFFLGDTFQAGDGVRLNYFSENLYNDNSLTVNGNTITWGDHMQETKDAGVISVLFGAGVNSSTDGVGSPPTDDYFWIQKVQQYYDVGAPLLDKEYGTGNDNPCGNGCAPVVTIISPSDLDVIEKTVLTPIAIKAAAWDLDGSLASVSMEVANQNLPLTVSGSNYTASWTPAAFGNYTLTMTATDNSGKISTEVINIEIKEFDPATCSVPAWDASVVYNVKGTEVSYDGKIYSNKWWTQGDLPSAGGVWQYLRNCSTTALVAPTGLSAFPSPMVYPNPAQNKMTVALQVEEPSEVIVMLFNLQGKAVKMQVFNQINKGSQQLETNIEVLEKGIYVYRIFSNGNLIGKGKISKN